MTPLDRLSWLQAVAGDRELSDAALRVAMVLPKWLPVAYPSVATIAAAASLCERATRGGLRALEVRGWLLRKASPGRSTNIYTIANPAPSCRDPEQSCRVQPGTVVPGPGTVVPPTRHSGAPEQGMNRKKRESAVRTARQPATQGIIKRKPAESHSDSIGPTYTLADGSDWRITKAMLPDLRKAYNGMAFSIELKRIHNLLLANPDMRVAAEAMPSLLAQLLAKPVPLTYIERVRNGGGVMICVGKDLTPEWEALPTELGISEDQVMVYLNRTPPPKFPSAIRAAVRTISAQTTTEDEPPSPDAISAALELEAQLAKENA